MKYLVDANVLSEPTRQRAAPEVVSWLRDHEAEICVDPIILGELRFGILNLPTGRRREQLEAWFDRGVEKLACVDWDRETGMRWAELIATLRQRGESIPIKDSLIAATALRRGLIVVTRNVKDFERSGVTVLDPFAL